MYSKQQACNKDFATVLCLKDTRTSSTTRGLPMAAQAASCASIHVRGNVGSCVSQLSAAKWGTSWQHTDIAVGMCCVISCSRVADHLHEKY